jgi:NAD(P)-dependent dehydrogenase (short-subunit alcohol dehydrogenase family)
MAGFTGTDVPNQNGRCIIVTGANTGIGWEAARALAAKGARVLLGCRNAARADEAMARIRAQIPQADLAHLPLDLADLASVRTAADMASAEPRVDVLLNNAGVIANSFAKTAQGFETHFGVNYLGTFALTALMLPKLAETAGSRVVNTSSLSYRFASIDWDAINAEQDYRPMKRYAASKLAVTAFTIELHRRLQVTGSPVTALACHPGFAATEIMGPSSRFSQLFRPLLERLLNTAEMGAWPALQAAADPAAIPGGFYGPRQWGEIRGSSGPARVSKQARDSAFAERLWDVSVEMTAIDPGLTAA